MKKKIALVYPWLNLYGGGEVFCEYTAFLLSKKYSIDLYYFNNEKTIHKKLKFNKKIKLIKIKSDNFVINFFCKNFMICAQTFLIYFFNTKIKRNYHFVYSLSGEFYSKFKTFQYLHICIYSLNIFEYSNFGLHNTTKKIFRFLLVLTCRFILNINKYKFKNVTTFSNSKWSYIRAKNTYQLKKHKVFYPCFKIPKYENGAFNTFEKRANSFVILGRVSPDKRIIEALNFFKMFKHIDPQSKLHIIGPIEERYLKLIKSKFTLQDVKFYGLVSLKKRDQIIKQCKYGLNFFYSEHFGRNALEMQKLGCIVFARNKGGIRELLFDDNQKFENLTDLLEKVKKVYFSKALQLKILNKNKILLHKFTDNVFFNQLFKNLK